MSRYVYFSGFVRLDLDKKIFKACCVAKSRGKKEVEGVVCFKEI